MLLSRTALRIASFTCALSLAIFSSPSSAQDHPKLPPGMTPEIMKMMETPGPPHPAGLPKDVVPVAGCIPAMGYHYVAGKNWPRGPIYGSYKGKPIFTEIMIEKTAFENGFNIDGALKPLPGYKIDHVDIWFEPHGHPGMEAPHYDIHGFYVSHAEHMKYCNNKSGKRPNFV